MKQCSIIWAGFKSGMKFVDGNFIVDRTTSQSDDLQDVQEVFFSQVDDTMFSTAYEFGKVAREYLEGLGYDVVFTDYEEAIDEALVGKQADEFVKLLRKSDEVKFSYEKISGAKRNARGTLKRSLLPKMKDVDKTRKRKKIPDTIIIYWDLDKDMFRCFRKSLFDKVAK